MFKLKVNKFGKVYNKKFATVQEVLNHMQELLFGYTSNYVNLYELQETKNALDIRFYLTYKKE